MMRTTGLLLAAGVFVLSAIAIVEAQQTPVTPPAAPQAAGQMPPGRGGRGGTGGSARVGRFKIYPREAVDRGLPAYNSTCGYCHGDRGKGGKAGPDLIASLVTLHDEDGVQLAAFVRAPGALESGQDRRFRQSDVRYRRLPAFARRSMPPAAARSTSPRFWWATPRPASNTSTAPADATSVIRPRATSKASAPIRCRHSSGTPRHAARGPRRIRPRSRHANPTAPYATVTLASGETVKGAPVRVTDFDVTLRLADGSTTNVGPRATAFPRSKSPTRLQAHVDIMTKLNDTDMHNLTAYLATLK